MPSCFVAGRGSFAILTRRETSCYLLDGACGIVAALVNKAQEFTAVAFSEILHHELVGPQQVAGHAPRPATPDRVP